MEIFDDIIPPSVFRRVQKEILSNTFPWFYGRVTSYNLGLDNLFLYSWNHPMLEDGNVQSPRAELMETVILNALEKAGQNPKQIHRIRLVLNTVSDKPYLTGVHTDLKFPHKTALIYLNDSDGDTIIYNEKYDTTSGLSSIDYYETMLKDNLTIFGTVSPKENRMVCFDGLQYHTGTTPVKTARRIAFNINYS